MLTIHSFDPFDPNLIILVDGHDLFKISIFWFFDPHDFDLMFLVDGLDVHVLYFHHGINLAILVDDFDFHDVNLMFLVYALDVYVLLSMSTIHNIFNPHDLNFISCLTILMFMFFLSTPKVHNLHLFFNLMVLVDDLDLLDFASIVLVDGFEPLSFYSQCLWLVTLIFYMWIFSL